MMSQQAEQLKQEEQQGHIAIDKACITNKKRTFILIDKLLLDMVERKSCVGEMVSHWCESPS
ncbi:hypothetical protein EON65_51025 [archaeon]|nr:MAG: hypothetical protein EON65_51025 [archaeon]